MTALELSDARPVRTTWAVFLATLAPMMTVPAIRRLLIDEHTAAPSTVHAFVAVGMLGAVIGAPLVARFRDARGDDGTLAVAIALFDGAVTLASSTPLPMWVLFALRVLHGASSMSLLALLFARFRGAGQPIVSRGGAAMMGALAVGPAIGGMLSRFGAATPFRVAGLVSLVVAALLSLGLGELRRAPPTRQSYALGGFGATARAIAGPIAVVFSQRFAIGGFVATFAVQARARLGWDDAGVGAGFSLFLVVFALAMVPLARLRDGRAFRWCLPLGGFAFALALGGLSVAPRWAVPGCLALAGLTGAMTYAPSLAFTATRANEGSRATSMAILNAAGSAGMVLGPTVAGLLELACRGSSCPGGALFLFGAGAVHAAVAALVLPCFRATPTARVGAPEPE